MILARRAGGVGLGMPPHTTKNESMQSQSAVMPRQPCNALTNGCSTALWMIPSRKIGTILHNNWPTSYGPTQ